MRIVLFTVEDTEFVPELLAPVIAEWRSSIVQVYVSRSLFRLGWLSRRAGELIKDGYPWCIRPGDLFRYLQLRWRSQTRRRGFRTVVEYLQGQGCSVEYLDEIRTDATRDRLKALNADVFLLGCFDKIAGPKFLSIPRLGAFNVHMGKLPEHRGGLSAFWVLRFGDREAGATIHRAVEDLDAGEIVAEIRVPVQTRSMDELMHETFRAAGPMVADALHAIQRGDWRPIDTAGRKRGYYYIPTSSDFREFYARGCRLI